MDPKSKKSELLYQVIYDATRDKFSILPTLSGIIIALIAIGISGGLFKITITIKIITSVLLLLMVLSLQIYYSETINLLLKAQKEFYEINGKESPNTSLSFFQSIKYLLTGKIGKELKESNFYNRLSSQLPSLALSIIWVIIFIIIYEVWS